jgi:hypothetical protein
MEFKVPKRHILRPKLSTDMVQRVLQWERQKRCPRREDGDKRGQENSRTLYYFIFQNYFSGHTLDKNLTHSFYT